MATLPELKSADLAALLSSKLCHDIISPVFGIQSGLELLDDMPNDAESMELVRSSTRSAVARLQFARIAYGASGSTQAAVDVGDAKTAAEGVMEHEKATLVWSGEGGPANKDFIKTILNLVVIANASISRGGEVAVTIDSIDPPRARVGASADRVRVAPRLIAMLDGDADQDPVDAQAIQPYYTLFLAQEAGLKVSYERSDSAVTFDVAP